jgi:hypothetical protein
MVEDAEGERQVAFILEHPGMSAWLKDALRTALPRHPVSVLNDLEVLGFVLRRRARAWAALTGAR